MKALNNDKHKKIAVQLSYSEAHFIGEALFHYKSMLQRLYGNDSAEEKRVSNMLYTIRNPEISKKIYK